MNPAVVLGKPDRELDVITSAALTDWSKRRISVQNDSKLLLRRARRALSFEACSSDRQHHIIKNGNYKAITRRRQKCNAKGN